MQRQASPDKKWEATSLQPSQHNSFLSTFLSFFLFSLLSFPSLSPGGNAQVHRLKPRRLSSNYSYSSGVRRSSSQPKDKNRRKEKKRESSCDDDNNDDDDDGSAVLMSNIKNICSRELVLRPGGPLLPGEGIGSGGDFSPALLHLATPRPSPAAFLLTLQLYDCSNAPQMMKRGSKSTADNRQIISTRCRDEKEREDRARERESVREGAG